MRRKTLWRWGQLLRTQSALKQFGFLVLVILLSLSFYGALPQPEFRKDVAATSSPVYVYKIVSAKTVYYQFIHVHLNYFTNRIQVTVSTWFWLQVSIHVLINGEEYAQINTGDSGSANAQATLPGTSNLIVEVWAHNMLPLPDDFHANIVLLPES